MYIILRPAKDYHLEFEDEDHEIGMGDAGGMVDDQNDEGHGEYEADDGSDIEYWVFFIEDCLIFYHAHNGFLAHNYICERAPS